MKKFRLLTLAFILNIITQNQIQAQERLDSIFPVRGFCIAAPSSHRLDDFIKFIDTELAPRKVNTLILRVDYNYQFVSHPELRDRGGLSNAEVKKLVAVCKKNNIQIIPQINLLGHQSWASDVGNLLKVYPQFDETPNVKMPKKYEWPNPDGLYCKSYCPLHPDVHKIVFELMDEICDAFEATAFHAGMDEVFYIGEDSCSRCKGLDKSVLFAGELTAIRDHLNQKNRKLWIWGDRLIDGRTTGIGLWEGSYNDTWRAIDMIPKDVMICDWHYERPDLTPVYFAMKGLSVATCPYRDPVNAVLQVRDMARWSRQSTPELNGRFRGMIQTVWSGADSFLNEFYSKKPDSESKGRNTTTQCFKAMYDEILKYDNPSAIK
jgi:hypothetical protein